MKISGNDIRPGNVIEHQGRLWRAVRIQRTRTAQRRADVQVELRDIRDGTKLNERFRSSETVERVRLDQRELQFLYSEGDQHTFMDNETFEQMTVPGDLLGDSAPFLQDGMQVTVQFYEGQPISVELPDSVILQVVEADPVVKGQTAASSYKPAMLENGIRTMVPPHVVIGDRVVVSTEDGSYLERA